MYRRIARWSWLLPTLVLVVVLGLAGSATGQRGDGDEAGDGDEPIVVVNEPSDRDPSPSVTDRSRVVVPPDSPTPVTIFVKVVQVLDIDERNNLFEVDALLTAEWTDIRVRADCTSESEVYKDEAAEALLTTRLWAPAFLVKFGRGPRVTSGLEVTTSCTGLVTYQERFTTTVSQRFTNLNDFPFDKHVIRFEVEPFGTSGKNAVQFAEFATDEQVRQAQLEKSADKFESDEWNFGAEKSTVAATPPVITTSLVIDRETGFYWWNIIAPLILIVSISCTVFWMRYQLAERLGVSITVLLTVVAFDFLTSDNLPRLPFTTRLDMFYNVSYVAVASTILFSVIAVVWNAGRTSAIEPSESVEHTDAAGANEPSPTGTT